MRLDSDGNLNDIAPNPVTVSGELVVIREGTEFSEIAPGSLEGKIVFIEYGWVDTVLISDELGWHRMKAVINGQPEGIVLATTFSNQPGISHGTFAADLGVIATLENEPSIPTVLMRLEDLPDGSSDPWDELAKQHSVEITWDTDVLSPAESGNLIARIPGKIMRKRCFFLPTSTALTVLARWTMAVELPFCWKSQPWSMRLKSFRPWTFIWFGTAVKRSDCWGPPISLPRTRRLSISWWVCSTSIVSPARWKVRQRHSTWPTDQVQLRETQLIPGQIT